MATKYVVNTHALVWFLENNPRLGANAKAILADPAIALVVPMIVLAEACWVIEHGKTSIPPVAVFLAAADADSRVIVEPITRTVLDKALTLTTIQEMHDRLIVATAMLLIESGDVVSLLTKDAQLHALGIVPAIW